MIKRARTATKAAAAKRRGKSAPAGTLAEGSGALPSSGPSSEEELAAAARRAGLRVEVAKQSVRLAKEEMKRARKRYKEAKREVKRARKKAEAARKAWKQVRRRARRGKGLSRPSGGTTA